MDYCHVHAYFFQSRYQVHVICMSTTIDQHWVNEWLEYNLNILTVKI